MTVAIIAALSIAYIVALIRHKRERQRIGSERVAADHSQYLEEARSKNTARLLGDCDLEFYEERISALSSMLEAATEAEERAREKWNHFKSLNEAGAVISDKATTRAANELYSAERRRLSIESQLHAARRGKIKAIQQLTE